MDKSCIEECPVDRIYEGDRKLCTSTWRVHRLRACEPTCPEGAIYVDWRAPQAAAEFVADNAKFFADVLPGRPDPIGSP